MKPQAFKIFSGYVSAIALENDIQKWIASQEGRARIQSISLGAEGDAESGNILDAVVLLELLDED